MRWWEPFFTISAMLVLTTIIGGVFGAHVAKRWKALGQKEQVRELQDTILLGRLWKDAVDKWDHVKQCFDKFLKEE